MASFPTIYRHGTLVQKPRVESMENTLAHDPAIRSTSEGGYVTTRARFTRLTRRWNVRYEWMSKVNKNTIKDFEDDHYAGALLFTWTNPEPNNDGTYSSYTVRFLEPVHYTPQPNTNWLFWTVEFVLEQV